MKDSRVGFYAGGAGGFGFYLAWQLLSLLWQTTAPEETAMKAVIGFVLGLVVGVLLYHGVYALVSKKLEVTGKNKIRNTILGVVAGLVIGFFFGLGVNSFMT